MSRANQYVLFVYLLEWRHYQCSRLVCLSPKPNSLIMSTSSSKSDCKYENMRVTLVLLLLLLLWVMCLQLNIILKLTETETTCPEPFQRNETALGWLRHIRLILISSKVWPAWVSNKSRHNLHVIYLMYICTINLSYANSNYIYIFFPPVKSPVWPVCWGYDTDSWF